MFWKYVQGKLNSRPGIPDLYTDNNKTSMINSDYEKAEIPAKHFSEVQWNLKGIYFIFHPGTYR